nr:HEAT repeat domain-containing protein [Candidatus Sigynarchaeota archaeon]
MDTKKLEKDLQNRHKDVQLAAMHEIKEHGVSSNGIIKLLEVFVRDPDHKIDADLKGEAIQALVSIKSISSTSLIIPCLLDQSPLVREIAAHALGKLEEKHAVQNLINALGDDSFSVRENSAFSLARIHDPRAVDALVQGTRSEDPEVRLSVMTALGAFETDPAIDALVAALSDPVPLVRFPAIIAFNKIKSPKAIDPLIENLSSEDPLLQKVASDALVFNLGWGSVRDGVLTSFGERRRLILTGKSPDASKAQDKGDVASSKKTMSSIVSEICELLDLDESRKQKLRNYLDELDAYYTLNKK